jgi:hypothetical protein
VADCKQRGLEHLAVADLNDDGNLDQADTAGGRGGSPPKKLSTGTIETD